MTIPANGHQRPASDHEPRKIGEVALAFDLDGGPWITARRAVALARVDSRRLMHWVDEGVISCHQDAPGRARLYLKPEMELIGNMGNGFCPNLRTVRRHVKRRVEEFKSGRGAPPTASPAAPGRPDQGPVPGRIGLPRPGFPKISKGRIAEVYGIPAYLDPGWMTAPFAARLVGVRQPTLIRWAREGLVSYRLDRADEAFRYLRPELLVIVRLKAEGGRLERRAIEKHLAQKVGAGKPPFTR